MRTLAIAAGLGGALLLSLVGQALADNEAGVPLAPADAAGSWTLESNGHGVCTITLSQRPAAAKTYAAKAAANCGDALPGAVGGWTPTADGMALVGADGQQLISFGRWSNSLFVAHRSSGQDIQLQRGGMENP